MTPAYADWSGGKRANPQCHAIIAMTGVEPIEQDFSYWSKRADRPPLLPPVKAPRQKVVAIERTGYGEAHVVGEDRYMVRLKAAGGDATMTLELTPGAGYTGGGASTDCGEVLCNTGYKTFGVIQTLEPAMKLCRVDIRGPSYGVDHEYSVGRNHRVDVTVEVTQDGREWRKIGELKGISGDCDFLPLEFEPTLVKKLRISATAAPYHLDYSPAMANHISGPDYPYFAWRLLAPAEATRPGKP
jgi:hypothetical protein